MRFIAKSGGSEAAQCISGFIDVQMAARIDPAAGGWQVFRVDYANFTRGPQLRGMLIAEQRGICAYTGVGLDDDRLVKRQPGNQTPPQTEYWYQPHIEHLKPQSQCQQELIDRGGIIGRDVGEDIAYHNLVAAIEVQGLPSEHFGAVCKQNEMLPLSPTNPNCAEGFLFLEQGGVIGLNDVARETIALLKLDHKTIEGWRAGAIMGFLPEGENTPPEKLRTIINLMDAADEGRLPEFSFVVAQIARAYLALQALRT